MPAPLTSRPAWSALKSHVEKTRATHLRELFAADPKRGERMTLEGCGLFLDYSKNRVTDETMKLLVQLANESDLKGRIDAMFKGEKINITEDRAVLHVALRAPRGASISVDGKNVALDVHEVLDKMAAFADRVREIGQGLNLMNCLTCKYREQIVGYERDVGQPQVGHHHHVEGIGTAGDHDHDHHHDHGHHHHGHDHHHGHGHHHHGHGPRAARRVD